MALLTLFVINSGSSSLKATLFQIGEDSFERLADFSGKSSEDKSAFQISSKIGLNKEEHSLDIPFSIPNVLDTILRILKEKQLDTFQGIAHRFVHGGKHYRSSVLLNPEVMEDLKGLVKLAPLHNQGCYEGMIWAYQTLGEAMPQVVAFDTAFYKDLPEMASYYAIPYELAQKYDIQRFGFHGISHQFLWKRYKDLRLKLWPKAITLHLGSGCSMTAIDNGRPIETSMGFTPLEGLIMGTRSGDIDPAIVAFLCKKEAMSAEEVIDLLNFHSGLLGVSGKSADMSVIMALASQDEHAQLAVQMFCYRIQKYLGAYIAALQGTDALIFSGGIGENSPEIREKICRSIEWMGIHLDLSANGAATDLQPGEVRMINTRHSKVRLFVIATDENLAIAEEAKNVFLNM